MYKKSLRICFPLGSGQHAHKDFTDGEEPWPRGLNFQQDLQYLCRKVKSFYAAKMQHNTRIDGFMRQNRRIIAFRMQ
jgi:hypothetical protein